MRQRDERRSASLENKRSGKGLEGGSDFGGGKHGKFVFS